MDRPNSIEGWICVPVYNEEEIISSFTSELSRVLATEINAPLRMHLLVVDDGSTDSTRKLVSEIGASSFGLTIQVLSLNRNYGQQIALSKGLIWLSKIADFVITMDADGEQPIEMIPQFIRYWEQGALLVNSLRQPSAELPCFKRWSSTAYYKMCGALLGKTILHGTADFRLWDGDYLRRNIHLLKNLQSPRILASWLDTPYQTIIYNQKVQKYRRSRFTLAKMYRLAFESAHVAIRLRLSGGGQRLELCQ